MSRSEINTRPPEARVSRRRFLGAASSAAVSVAASVAASTAAFSAVPALAGAGRQAEAKKTGFKLKYAPGLGMFKNHAGPDLADQLKFIADQGFPAFFDNGLMGRPVPEQEAIARQAQRLNLAMGPFVAYADFSVKSFVGRDPKTRTMLQEKLKTAVETAKRTNAQWTLVVPGRFDESLEWNYQTANVIENLKWCAGLCEPSGLIMVIEPLNPKDHPGLFLTKVPQAYQICKAVGSPCCKIIDDLYHQQITEGNLIPNIQMAWEEIASFHIGDNPGRKEPTTGEINYKNIFKAVSQKGYKGVLCMEHGQSLPGKEGEAAVIAAYRACDEF